jgi:hypothetical protein
MSLTTRPLTFACLLLPAVMACSSSTSHRDLQTVGPLTAPPSPVAKGDTVFMLSAPEYELMSRQRADLAQAYVLDRVALRYRWLFGATPPGIVMFLGNNGEDGSSPIEARDTVRIAAPTRAVDASLAPSRADAAAASLSSPVAFAIARGWLRSMIEGGRGLNADSMRAVAPPPTILWFELGATMLLTSSAAPGEVSDGLLERESPSLTLDSLFALATDADLHA